MPLPESWVARKGCLDPRVLSTLLPFRAHLTIIFLKVKISYPTIVGEKL